MANSGGAGSEDIEAMGLIPTPDISLLEVGRCWRGWAYSCMAPPLLPLAHGVPASSCPRFMAQKLGRQENNNNFFLDLVDGETLISDFYLDPCCAALWPVTLETF